MTRWNRSTPRARLLGIFEEWDFSTGERLLSAGDTFALYTGGVTESFNDAGEEHRLIESLRRHRGQLHRFWLPRSLMTLRSLTLMGSPRHNPHSCQGQIRREYRQVGRVRFRVVEANHLASTGCVHFASNILRSSRREVQALQSVTIIEYSPEKGCALAHQDGASPAAALTRHTTRVVHTLLIRVQRSMLRAPSLQRSQSTPRFEFNHSDVEGVGNCHHFSNFSQIMNYVQWGTEILRVPDI
jgi:hypothetical protein